jgi:hypothetical protein
MFACPATDDFFRSRIDHMIDLRHPGVRRSPCRVTLCGAGRRLRRAPEPQPRRDRLTVRRTRAGNTSRACESLTQTIRELHDQACIEAAGATAVRRTFGVRLDMLRSPGPDSVVTML